MSLKVIRLEIITHRERIQSGQTGDWHNEWQSQTSNEPRNVQLPSNFLDCFLLMPMKVLIVWPLIKEWIVSE